VPAVVSISTASLVNYRSSATIILNSDSPGRATFYGNDKRIAGCISLLLSGSGVSYSVQCNWKPFLRGAVLVRAVLTPSNGNLVTSTGMSSVAVTNRSGTR
jgi:hypothetical protein